jgi:hypothetical protein
MAAPHTPWDLHGCEKKGVAREGFCKRMKIKDLEIERAGGGICIVVKTKGAESG